MRVWPTPAKLNDDQIKKLNEMEKDLDTVLIAFEKPSGFADLSVEKLEKIKSLEDDLGLKLIALN
ncbi:MAG: hypothetical protein GY870_18100 [archaeon]|nr:hypothetical protein [archaeon]